MQTVVRDRRERLGFKLILPVDFDLLAEVAEDVRSRGLESIIPEIRESWVGAWYYLWRL